MRGRLLVMAAFVLLTFVGGTSWAAFNQQSEHDGILTPPVVIQPAAAGSSASSPATPSAVTPRATPSAVRTTGLGEPVSTEVPVVSPTGTPSIVVTPAPGTTGPQTVPRDVDPIDTGGWHDWHDDDRPGDPDHDDG